MNKANLVLLSLCSIAFTHAAAVQLHAEPHINSEVITEINPEHQLTIETQDWVKVTDTQTGQTGWAELSKLRSNFSDNSQWGMSIHSSSNEGTVQKITYSPYSKDESSQRIEQIHNAHKEIIRDFDKLWNELK